MGTWVSIDIETNLRFCKPDVCTALEALRKAVVENWANPELHDEWSDDTPKFPIEPTVWAARIPYSQWQSERHLGGLDVNVFDATFSPSSSYVCTIVIGMDDATGGLSLRLSIPERAFCERIGQREMERMDWEWREIRLGRGELEPTKTGPDEDHPEYWAWWDKYEQLQGSERAWPKNQKALLHLVEKLREMIPVRHVDIDVRLQNSKAPE